MNQKIFNGGSSIIHLSSLLSEIGSRKWMLVADDSYQFLSIKNGIDSINIPHVFFSNFTSNPLYEDVCAGVRLFNAENCDTIVAIGGGSSIDVAKCIKLFSKMDLSENYLKQEYSDNGIPIIAIPTTAGTGSESTRYAVIYYEGKKQSVTHDSIIPNYAVLDSSVLKTLPLYQKKCTMLDALCQGIESWWSVNSTAESMKYSKMSVETVMRYYEAYIFRNDDEAAEQIMLAANYAGRAINITQTTAAHAMSYKLTSMYRLPHGHAVAICLPHVWEYMLNHLDKCVDPRGSEHLRHIFTEIACAMSVSDVPSAIETFKGLMSKIGISSHVSTHLEDVNVLAGSVNVTRLKNNPVSLSDIVLRELYTIIVVNKMPEEK